MFDEMNNIPFLVYSYKGSNCPTAAAYYKSIPKSFLFTAEKKSFVRRESTVPNVEAGLSKKSMAQMANPKIICTHSL